MSVEPTPGWYPDPSGGPGQRYWDGTWTGDFRALPPPAQEPAPTRRSVHPAFAFLAVISLLVTALPAIAIFGSSDSNSVNPFAVLWLLWGGFWTILWWLFARGRR
jgi:hypothetical protein